MNADQLALIGFVKSYAASVLDAGENLGDRSDLECCGDVPLGLSSITSSPYPDHQGILRSRGFPGLWLAVSALLSGEMTIVLSVLQQGLNSSEHQAFVRQFTLGIIPTAGAAGWRR